LTPGFNDDEKRRLDILKNRESKARCLDCGGHDFEFIPHVEPDKQQALSGTPVRTGLFHRGCGGRICADFDKPNMFMDSKKLPQRNYNIEGIEMVSKPNLS